jgi:predicted nucleic acid-binding protein
MIFVDTWAWIALTDKTDQYHAAAREQHQKHLAALRRYVTSDYVLTEFINYLYSSVPSDQAQTVVESLFQQSQAGSIELIHVSADQFNRAWQLRKKYHDKPAISLIDFTSFIVMRDLGITDVFSGDAHFLQVGLGFRLLP